jgi:peptide-methionine (S)-S-oxide reductase
MALLLMVAGAFVSRVHAESARAVPPPAEDKTTTGTTPEVAVLAGGCFWGVQGVFQHVDGVSSVVSGYAGGSKDTAQYETVSTRATGHAESVRVTFDPHRISYGHILQIYFSVAHDPTELNRRGPDVGTQYRSAIFPLDAEQQRIAKAYIQQLDQAHVFSAAIVTRIEPGRTFYPAEAYHQDFLTRNPTNPYIAYYDLPKIRELQKLFPDRYRADPMLVAATQ